MSSFSLTTKVHMALILGNSFWGIGAVVGALGLATTHPVAFLMIRQLLAGLLLLAGASSFAISSPTTVGDDAAAKTSKPIQHLRRKLNLDSFRLHFKQHWKIFASVGLTLFGSQFGFLVGITLAGPVTCSVWQPSQPIIMACICILMGWERWNSVRMSGVAMAFCGCIIMVVLAPQSPEEKTEEGGQSSSSTLFWIGNFLFLINCLSDPSYVILSKRLLDVFSPLSITGYSYLVSATYMGIATLVSFAVVPMFATTAPSSVWISGSIIPPLAAVPAMIWFVVFSSAGASALITWANQHATGTLVMSYTVLQPVSTVLLTVVLLGLGAVPNCESISSSSDGASICLVPPNWGTVFGMTGVGLGLSLIILTEPKSDKTTSSRTHKTLSSSAIISQGEKMLLV